MRCLTGKSRIRWGVGCRYRVLAALDRHCEHVLVHTGQNYDYELNQVFFDDLGIKKTDYFLNSAEGRMAEAAGRRQALGHDHYRR
ncbi:UDP-N-acetylglucosamine 2-epimerase [Candidatus Symbiobacter mobilis CR]|uniref:UDP-N-acetylglucosamine 2-epimerase n=1 Tax=Candidatus Symbiobacter mobilis CR TaxID=946483 RepID=U5N8J9_9BURK|nr:UDP-N-acetylglucosamine 2-epimerase [Candidatus Symbiobacter mobilis CR]